MRRPIACRPARAGFFVDLAISSVTAFRLDASVSKTAGELLPDGGLFVGMRCHVRDIFATSRPRSRMPSLSFRQIFVRGKEVWTTRSPVPSPR